MKKPCLLMCLSLALFGCETTSPEERAAIAKRIPVDANFTKGQQTWSGQPSYRYRWAVRNFDGKLHVCGAGVFLNAQRRAASKDAMAARRIADEEGETVIEDLSFFARVSRASQLDTATANCRDTGLKARSAGRYAVRGRLIGGRSF